MIVPSLEYSHEAPSPTRGEKTGNTLQTTQKRMIVEYNSQPDGYKKTIAAAIALLKATYG